MGSELLDRVRRAAAAWAPGCDVLALDRLPGGRSSDTFVAHCAGAPLERIVVKAAPEGLPAVRNRDVLRQARIVRLLAGAPGVRVPQVLFEDDGAPPWFAMTFVAGETFEPNLDPSDALPPPAVVSARARAAARMLAALHAAPAPDDEPLVRLPQEISRWEEAFATVDDDLRDGWEECAAALRSAMPSPAGPSIVHGDYRVGNLLCDGPDVNAIIDWEIWSRSDPRIDLAWFLIAAQPELHPSARRSAPGMPSADELLAEYVDAGGAATGSLDWFRAHALFKVAAATALLVKKARKRGDDGGLGERAARNCVRMIAAARKLLA